MNKIEDIIYSLQKEDIRFFKLYCTRLNYGKNRKDVQLFDAIKEADSPLNEEQLAEKLYPSQTKNAYYRLKNRLSLTLNKSLLLQNIEEDFLKSEYFFSLYKLYLNKKLAENAFYYLKQAEKFALQSENYGWLDMIYSEMISYSINWQNINPDNYLRKRAANKVKMDETRQLDEVLAQISYRLKTAQNYASKSVDFHETLEKIIAKYAHSSYKKNIGTQLKIYRAVSLQLLQKNDFKTLLEYSLKTYKQLSGQRAFTKNNHENKLQIISFIINSNFKLGKYEDSLAYANHLFDAMHEFDKALFEKYAPFYQNALVINYSKLEPKKAIQLLQDKKNQIKNYKAGIYDCFTFINLALCYYKLQQPNEAIKELIGVQQLDVYKKLDEQLRMKIEIAEQLIRFEMLDFNIIEYRINQIKRSFKDLMESNQRDYSMIRIVSGMIKSPDFKTNKALQKQVSLLLNTSSQIDSDIIYYNEWLLKYFKF